MFKNKVLLITGGTGSFGNAVLDKFLNSDLKEIRIFSRDEKKQEDMRIKYCNSKIKFYIGDIRNYNSIRDALVGVDYVFHAAALKQVPSCEFFPMEANLTNVIGTENVLNAAIENKVAKVILLSTDKAVYPINAMGITKSLAEKLVHAKARQLGEDSVTTLCITRYGNVMASRGSVIPLFAKQINVGKDITITNPEMTRFLMSLEEAVDLVMYAFENGQQGDLFVQKAPACTVEMLAQAMMKIMGKEVNIKNIGARHGEKLFESLLTNEELVTAIDEETYFRIKLDNRDLNYNIFIDKGDSSNSFDKEYNSHNTERLDLEGTIDKLMSISYIRDLLEGIVREGY